MQPKKFMFMFLVSQTEFMFECAKEFIFKYM